MKLPLPKIAPKYREVMRMAFRNDRNFFNGTCDFSGKSIISLYPSDSPYKIYEVDVWMSDKWEPPSLEYDPDVDFFRQYQGLQRIAPRPNLFSVYNENCEYTNACEKCKNCYMVILSDRCEDCYYLDGSFGCKDCADCSFTYDSELCYELVDCRACYHARYSHLCENSSEISFCFDLKGCSDCFMSSGLRNKKYHIFNQPYSREDYENKMSEVNFSSQDIVGQLLQRFFEEIMPSGYSKIINCENSTGNFLINCKNCKDCLDCEEAEDCLRVRIGINGIRDVVDSYAIVDGSELIYNNVSTTEGYNCHNVIGCWTTKDSCYSEYLKGCRDCIGCISLKQKKYCVLNKQYSQEDYEKIKADIMQKMGDYFGDNFPIALAPFSYQDSVYSDYHSLSREELEKIGWRYGEERKLDPDKPFKIIPQEKKLLEKIQVPVPVKHPELRYRDRIKFRSVK